MMCTREVPHIRTQPLNVGEWRKWAFGNSDAMRERLRVYVYIVHRGWLDDVLMFVYPTNRTNIESAHAGLRWFVWHSRYLQASCHQVVILN